MQSAISEQASSKTSRDYFGYEHAEYPSFHFRESDPNQHILDTLEQCISIIIEKMQHLETDKPSSRLSSLDYARVNGGNENDE